MEIILLKQICIMFLLIVVGMFLVKKGYLRHYRQGRVFFYQILVPLDTYKGQLTNDYVNFWNHSNADEFLCALAEERPLREDEVERIQKLIDGMDN